ncbi:MAG TPA: hypothetical protein PK440_18920 [Candidatus Accumulibacter phosphatis]|nr:MAG: hypothetical protein AW07_03645 [Candidatus Accumulibacter sp. SK-11]HAY26725.1 hypothetical protein [Accumulibacter sp.]HRL78254.1 hypothetical protein [Candidatus Accumulibacter phosphatis]HCN69233.1 hypothetical protein [Accumulibacter sp.]HCV13724.1 hypothetical protein [Accumulibacter sp.]
MTTKFTLPEWLSSRARAAEVATLLATAIAPSAGRPVGAEGTIVRLRIESLTLLDHSIEIT